MELTRRQSSEILSKWGVVPKRIDPIKQGLTNYNWVIFDGKSRYVLRRISFYKPKAFSDEMRYLNYFRKIRFKYEMPVPIKTRDGGYFVKFHGGVFWLYKYIEGKTIPENVSIMQLRKVAKLIAEFHIALMRSPLKGHMKAEPFSAKLAAKEIRSVVKKLAKKRKLDKADRIFCSNAKRMLYIVSQSDKKKYGALKAYAIHKDIGMPNIIWKGNNPVALIDVGQPGANHCLIRDLASALQYSCNKNYQSGYTMDFKKAIEFLKTYSRYRKLSRLEVEGIPDMLACTYVEDFDYIYWLIKNRPGKVNNTHLLDCAKSAEYCYGNREEIAKILLAQIK